MAKKPKRSVARGSRHGGAKLNERAVQRIRSSYAGGFASYRQLGELYGVSFKNIGFVVRRETWAHV